MRRVDGPRPTEYGGCDDMDVVGTDEAKPRVDQAVAVRAGLQPAAEVERIGRLFVEPSLSCSRVAKVAHRLDFDSVGLCQLLEQKFRLSGQFGKRLLVALRDTPGQFCSVARASQPLV